MEGKKVIIFLVAVIVIVLVALGVVFYSNNKKDSEQGNNTSQTEGDVAGASTQDSSHDPAWIEGLAKALNEKGMVMYGAYWCSHCQNQKKMFGDAVKYIDYVECDPSGTNANPDECKANGVEGYPTWIYQGQKFSGEQTLEKLAQTIGFSQQ